MVKLSGVIITYNEEEKIEECIQSLLPVVDEIIIVDSFSTDNTKSICLKFNVKFIEQEFLGYKEQKQFALEKASFDHIVSLDADERLSVELQKSILSLKSNWKYDAYSCNRLNYFCGQWIRHTTWYPDRKIRIFNKLKARWGGLNPHDRIILDREGKIGFLKGNILHKTYNSYSEFNKQVERFSTISAQSHYEMGKKASIFNIVLNPLWAFIQSYFIKLGFLDGLNGFIISVQTANIRFLKYSKLYELHRKNGHFRQK